MTKRQKLIRLFFSMLYISAFTFGGGFVIVTFMKKRFVDELHWIDEEEMLDMTALAQSSPGAIAVNAAILVGWKVGGFAGMLTAVIGTIIPPISILAVISLFYAAFATNRYVALMLRGMQAGVAAVIFDVVCRLGKNIILQKDIVRIVLMAGAFIVTIALKVNVIFIILAAAATGIALNWESGEEGMIYLNLIVSFLQVGLFSIGGGYAAMPLIQNQAVTLRGWLTMSEFTDLVTIAEMTPGPIAVNSATFVGMRVAGIPGALAATFGCILPSCIIVSLLAYIYRRWRNLSGLQSVLSCLRPAVVALIAGAGCSILKTAATLETGFDLPNIALFVIAFLLINRKKISPILTMLGCGVVYMVLGIM